MNMPPIMKRSVFCIIFLLVLAATIISGCRETASIGRSTVPYVEGILSGETAGLSILHNFDPSDSKGTVSLVGPYDSCLTARFLTADDFDNIDGKSVSDGLPDFAGERIDILEDAANLPYEVLLNDDETALRTLAVKNFMFAVDTLCSKVEYGDEISQSKLPAKVVVYTSVINALAGAFDIDTLCRAAGSPVPVIFPARLVFEQQLSRNIEHLHVLVLTDSLTASAGIYQKLFESMAREKGEAGTGCAALYARRDSTVNSILSQYKSQGGGMPVSAIIIDGSSFSAGDLKASLEEIMTVQTEQNLNSRKLITKELSIIDMNKAVTDECYRILRQNNIFTHNIAYPASKSFVTVKNLADGGFKFVEN